MGKCVKQYVSLKDVNLYNLGDVHLGDDACDRSLFEKAVNAIKEDPFARWVSTGDLLNVALVGSKSNSHHSMNLQEELELLVDYLNPIVDKCLGLVGSNHHKRLDRMAGMHLDKLLGNILGIPYLGAIGRLVITCGRASYWVMFHHGVGMGSTPGAKANGQERLLNLIPGYDLYLSGHTHSRMLAEATQPYVDRKRIRETKIHQYKQTTGHFISYDDSYAADMALKEMPKGMSTCVLYANNNGAIKHMVPGVWGE